MADANSIRMGKAFVEIHGELNPLDKALTKGESKFKAFGEKISRIGESLAKAGGAVLGVEGIAGLIEKLQGSSEAGAGLLRMARQTGATVEALAELGYAAKSVGVPMETVTGSIDKMQKTLFEAAKGSKESIFALNQLRLSVGQLEKLSPDKQFELIGERLRQIKDPALRDALAMQIFGKSGAEVIPIFAQGAEALAKLRQRAVELGRKTHEQAEANDEFTQALDDMWMSVHRVTGALSGALLPVVNGTADKVQEAAAWISKLIDNNKEWVIWTAKIAGVTLAAGAVLAALPPIFGAVGAAASGAALIAGTSWGVFSAAVAAIVSPVGLATLTVVNFALTIGVASGAIGTAVEWICDKWHEMEADFVAAWDAIKNAVKAGNLQAAFHVIGALIDLEIGGALLALDDKWIKFKFSMISMALEAAQGVAAAFIEAFGELEKVWNATQIKIGAGVAKLALMLEKKRALNDAEAGAIDFGAGFAGAALDNATDADTKRRKLIAGTAIGAAAGPLGNAAKAAMDADLMKNDIARALLKMAFDGAVAAADAEGKKPNPKVKELPTPDQLTALGHADKHGGIGAVDARTREGYKVVGDAIRSQGDPQQAAAKSLAQLVKNDGLKTRYQKDTRDALKNGFRVLKFPS